MQLSTGPSSRFIALAETQLSLVEGSTMATTRGDDDPMETAAAAAWNCNDTVQTSVIESSSSTAAGTNTARMFVAGGGETTTVVAGGLVRRGESTIHKIFSINRSCSADLRSHSEVLGASRRRASTALSRPTGRTSRTAVPSSSTWAALGDPPSPAKLNGASRRHAPSASGRTGVSVRRAALAWSS
ncbi:unnamed protein product [Linum trigynum]|uniref:Uncharacterized protein n=1 Tax=Linum trigynum TaxID=586398 RepID=A0AAV2FNW9_9ROSI